MGKVIIGIHGLNNKPAKGILEADWLSAIKEGLTRNCGGAAPDQLPKSALELAYWADVMYPNPIAQDQNPEPYLPAAGEGPLPSGKEGIEKIIGRIREGLVKGTETAAAAVAHSVINKAINTKAPDVDRYRDDPTKRTTVQNCLCKLLVSAHSRHDEIMLIAHSMGSFVAYDVLANRSDLPAELKISHFVTIGSPLGLHEVKTIVRDGAHDLHVPDCVERWTNFVDPDDLVARWDTHLGSDYKKNSSGVKLSDHLVTNGYVNSEGESNHHKIYGYLRTPEMSEAIAQFLR